MHNPPAPVPLLERALGPLRRFLQRRRLQPIRDAAGLRSFLQTRASYVAQMTLYGYLRTRSGTRFPELFNDDHFVESINIAKWHVWLACLSDLAAYAGGMLRRNARAEAGPEYPAHADRVRARLALCDWAAQADGDGPFVESPSALVYWAPIVEELKVLDEEIVRNSVRFRWNEIRAQLRRALDATAVMDNAASL